MITVVVLMCHMLGVITQPVCHEVIVIRQEMSIHQCMLSQAAVADWKMKSIYKHKKWYISNVKCESGDYQMKDII